MTPKHIIVSDESGMINWYRIEHPFENAKPEEKFITIFDDIDKQYNFKNKLAEEAEEADTPANFMIYNKSHQSLMIGTHNGILSLLKVPSEKISDEDYENEGQEEQKLVDLETPLQITGRFHTDRVNCVKPLGTSTQMVTISADNTVAIWEVTTQKQLSCITMPVEPISLDVSKEGSVIFIGTIAGTFRIYDITNRENPRLISQLKFYEDEKPVSQILSSDDGKIVLISCTESDTFFVMSQKAEDSYDIYG